MLYSASWNSTVNIVLCKGHGQGINPENLEFLTTLPFFDLKKNSLQLVLLVVQVLRTRLN